ncbi:hypothetical protein [Nocardia cyriacigeorgica]|uniref:hypothetical protein n=1 Tax=Nocardia cyriacigeorgica TaxID=135487 RepID=UPI002016F553|nr:hypothetical protein [Nocardia cyriacigeorgica]
MTRRGSDPTRLTVVDEIFLRTHRGLGTPIALQGLWRTGDRVEPELLEDLHARLRRGPLGRRVVRPRVPGARRSWQPTVRAHPLDQRDEIAVTEVLEWADTLGADLDPEYAPGWRLSSAPLDDGGTVIALTCSHVLADARGLIIAVDAALTAGAYSGASSRARALTGHKSPGTALSIAAGPPAVTGHSHISELTAAPQSDWNDAWKQLVTVLGGTAAALGSALRRSSLRMRTAIAAGHRVPKSCGAALENASASGSAAGEDNSAGEAGSPGDDNSAVDDGSEHRIDTRADSARADSADAARAAGPPHSPAADGTTDLARADRGHGRPGTPRPPALTGRGHARAEWARPPEHGRIGEKSAMSFDVETDHPATVDDPHSTRMPAVGAVLCCPAADWHRAAATSAGTGNSLFVWFVANMLWASGFPGATIEAALPVDTRDEPRVDNDLAMTAITITRADSPGIIRAEARAAYERRMTSPAGLPEETLQLVPDRLAYAMSRGAGERDILCSNIGTLPPSLHSFGPHECTAIAARAIHPGLTFARRPRTRLSGYLSRSGDTYTLALVGLAPELIPNSAALQMLADDVARPLGLPIRTW